MKIHTTGISKDMLAQFSFFLKCVETLPKTYVLCKDRNNKKKKFFSHNRGVSTTWVNYGHITHYAIYMYNVITRYICVTGLKKAPSTT